MRCPVQWCRKKARGAILCPGFPAADYCNCAGDCNKVFCSCDAAKAPTCCNTAGAQSTDVGQCVENCHVVSNVCTSCPYGRTRYAGDDASGPDTTCVDLFADLCDGYCTDGGVGAPAISTTDITLHKTLNDCKVLCNQVESCTASTHYAIYDQCILHSYVFKGEWPRHEYFYTFID